MTKLTPHFTLEEMYSSNTAKLKGINNRIPTELIPNIIALVMYCLEPIREYYDKPVIVTSGYRCPELNKAVGGAKTSQHTKGQAADIIIRGVGVHKLFETIQFILPEYDQLIEEHSSNTSWVHISYNKEHNRKERLQYRNGRYYKI